MSILDLLLCVAAVVIHIAESLAFYTLNIFARIFEAKKFKQRYLLYEIKKQDYFIALRNGRDLHFEVFSTFYPIVHCSASVYKS